MEGWGSNSEGLISEVPLGPDFLQVDTSSYFNIALHADGSLRV
jgi:hypothetical protein